jgi:hypothetical protein
VLLQPIYPSFLFFLPSLRVMPIINLYDRYVSPTSPENTPSRRRFSFSRKAAPVVSITTASATSTGQENHSPTSCIPFPSTPLPTPAQTCRDAIYFPFQIDPLSTPDPTERTPSTHTHRRQRSNSGLISIHQRNPRPLAPLNSESRATGGCIDLGKSTAALSITSSGVVSKVDSDHLRKTLSAARQKRLQQLDRKRNPSMVTKKQSKKATADAKFLLTLHHSITWHIETKSDEKGQSIFLGIQNVRRLGNPRPLGSHELDAQDGLLAQRILQHLAQRGQISPPALSSDVHPSGTMMYPVPAPFPTPDASAPSPYLTSPAPVPGPGIMTMPQIVAALHMKHRDRATRSPRPTNPVTRKARRSPLSQLC